MIEKLYNAYLASHSVTTDSRAITPGCLFFAFRGATYTGNAFVPQALEQGAALCVTTDTRYADDPRCVVVDDVLATLQQLARRHRAAMTIPVVGITGTNGKTTTKELVHAVLARRYRTAATAGNFNNHLGVPLTLLSIPADTELAIVEMGANHPGEISDLCNIADPDCGLITNVGRAHLQGFGSFKNVVKTKGELYDFLGRRGESLVFLNADNERLVDILPDNVWVAPYSTNLENVEGCTVGEVISCAPFLKFRWRESDTNLEEKGEGQEPVWYEVQTQLIGAYNIDNMMAAIAVGLNFGVEPADINRALEAYQPSNNRSQLTVTEKNHLVVDAYNANPSSMRAALDNFRLMDVKPKMASLGEMRELGNSSRKEHQKLVAQLAESNLDEVWLVGDEFTDLPATFRHFHDVEEVKAAISEQQPQGRYILIKGSNSTRLYQLPELL